jgi:thiol-disulfide isomerase/thioredoxin
MKSRSLFLAILFLVEFNNIIAQPHFNKLKPGEKVPDITFTILNNGKVNTATLADFKGKIVILDYWSIWCGSCIAAFPKLQALQEKFRKDVEILPVSFLHSPQTVQGFIKRRKGTEDEIKLPLAIFENTNNKLFRSLPTTGYPYEIWIDRNGNFIQASESSDINEANLVKVIKGGVLNFKSHNLQMNFDQKKPLLTDNNGGPDTGFAFRSLITKYIDSIPANRTEKTSNHILLVNRSIGELVKMAVKNGINDDPYNKSVFFEGTDSCKNHVLPSPEKFLDHQWEEANLYCYDLKLPAGYSKEELFQFMHDDLDRFFRIKTSWEMHLMKCFILERTDSIDRLSSKANQIKAVVKKDRIDIANMKVKSFLDYLPGKEKPILIDDTGITNNIDINIALPEKFDIAFYNTQLSRFGLKFELAERMVPTVIIKQRMLRGITP